MPRIQLTAASCAEAACRYGKKKTDYFDTIVPGFTLEVRSSGGKTYYLRYTDPHGKQRQIKIGRFEAVKFGAAKEKARKLRSEVELNGDPAERKEKKKAIPTYAKLAEQHIDHAKTYQKRPTPLPNTQSTALYRCDVRPKWRRSVSRQSLSDRSTGICGWPPTAVRCG